MTSTTTRKHWTRPADVVLDDSASSRSSLYSSSVDSHSSSTFSYGSTPSSASSYASSFSVSSRPLPTPPTAPYSVPKSHRMRPLPTPPHSARSTQVHRPGDQRSPPAHTGSAKASLHLDIPGPSAELRVTTPITPLTPISFSFPRRRSLRRKREEELARRMKRMGFVEVPTDEPVGTAWCPENGPDDQEVVVLVDDSSEEGEQEQDGCKVQMVSDFTRSMKRYSRKWLRESRGTQWVEEDYHQVLQCLRKLR